jgi:MFS family permease
VTAWQHVREGFGRPALPTLLAMLINTGWHASLPFVSLHAREIGITPLGIGLLFSAQALASMLIALPSGVWIDRFGVRFFEVCCLLLGGVGYAAMWLVSSPPGLFLGLAVVGLSHTAAIIAAQAHLIVFVDPSRRNHVIGTHFFYSSFGFTIGPLVGTALVHATGNVSAAFAGGIGASMVALLPALWAGSRARRAAGGPAAYRRAIPFLSRDARVGVAATLVAEFAYVAWATFFPLGLRAAGHSPQVVGTLFTIRGISASVVRPALGFLATRFTRRRVLAGALVGTATGLLAGTALHSVSMAVAASILFGTGVGLLFPTTAALMVGSAPDHDVGHLLALRQLVTKLSEIVAPVTIGVVAARSVPGALWVVGLICLGMGATLLRPCIADQD